MPMKIFPILQFLLCISIAGFSQSEPAQVTEYADSTQNFVEIAGFGSNNSHTPFWIQANQFGTVPLDVPAGSARVSLENYWSLSSSWRAGVGVEAVGILNEHNKILLPQLHATLKFKNWELFVGRKKQHIGLADSTLGTGSYAWSGNALPIPKISIGTSGFVAVPLTKGWISFNAFYSDGFFEKGRPATSGLKFHQKAFYARIGKVNSKLKLYGGFNHQVQWGGKSKFLVAESGNLPDGLSNYINAVFGTIGGHGDDVTHFDSTNRVGNHLGSLDVAIEVETYGTSIHLYRQFIYEDGSLFYFEGIFDGLNGLRIRRKNSYGSNFEVTEGVLEFLYTKDQGGDQFEGGNGKKRGNDNYFNNQQIRDGWSYYDRTIGTPFIPPTSQTSWKWPAYNNFTSNNRVMVWHVGLKGTLFRNIQWHTKLSYSDNSGTYRARFLGSPKQFSGIIGAQTHVNALGGMTIKGSYASDMGDLYRKTQGFMLGIRKDFSFN
ncbi:capsule assembly Wzi family protein [Dyadobacter sp. LJ419]|uniref:Capsule assembly Wzi family protein n=1 Tax=Dyadobacter chenwenxiniae TaxID=2906456 RepID=A0A9X1PJI6_9BACT|nr:capsule assembly Wzi family protein [Dyadobacter chenwenxiniae]MCF0061309.1 capsule assembly Wzi family protein [Dyadobacter chenwenxiniae]